MNHKTFLKQNIFIIGIYRIILSYGFNLEKSQDSLYTLAKFLYRYKMSIRGALRFCGGSL